MTTHTAHTTPQTEQPEGDFFAVYRETEAGFEHIGYVPDEAALEAEARAALEAHEGPQLPPPPPPPSGVVAKAEPRERFLRHVRVGEPMSVGEWTYQIERRRRERERLAAELEVGAITTLCGSAA